MTSPIRAAILVVPKVVLVSLEDMWLHFVFHCCANESCLRCSTDGQLATDLLKFGEAEGRMSYGTLTYLTR